MRALAMRQTSDRRQACGANHHGGGGLGQPPADAPDACGEPRTQFDFQRQELARLGRFSRSIGVQLGDDRQAGPDFLGSSVRASEHDACSFAVGGARVGDWRRRSQKMSTIARLRTQYE